MKAIIYGPRIEQREIISESEKFVTYLDADRWMKQARESKAGISYAWFDTWGDAHEWLKTVGERSLESAKQKRLAAEKFMDSVLGMAPPM